MKLIVAYIQPEKLNDVLEAKLTELGTGSLAVMPVPRALPRGAARTQGRRLFGQEDPGRWSGLGKVSQPAERVGGGFVSGAMLGGCRACVLCCASFGE